MRRTARVLLADDSAFVRRATQRMLEPLGVRVVGTATTGDEAVRLACALLPDLVILDVDMPGTDGLQALERIMAACPTSVLLLSSLTRAGADVTLRALEAGAVDFLDKGGAGSSMEIHQLAPLLRDKVRAILDADGAAHPLAPPAPAPAAPLPPPPLLGSPYEVVVVGSSTGGPRALAEVVPALPEGFSAGVLVAQHMPAGFTETLAERLDRRSPLRVAQAAGGETVRPGEVWVAPGGCQMTAERAEDGTLRVRVWEDRSQLHRPCVDLLFESAARASGARAVGVVLTGMGSDGALGLKAIREAGGRALVESAETAVIDGMTAAARPYAERVLPLGEIAPALAELCGGRR